MAGHQRIRITATGWGTPLLLEDAGEPAPPTGNQVLVRVEACGVCHRDLLDRTGRFPFIQLPVTPGHEAAGVVVATGPDVTEWKVGDRVATMHHDACGQCASCVAGETSICQGGLAVLGILADGGYAATLTVPQSALFSVGSGLTWPQAAVLHCTFGTAYRDLATLGKVKAGERILITGANGGVGSAAVQLGRRLGAEVIAAVRDARHRAFVEQLGAHAVVVSEGQRIHDQPEVGKVDFALDTVGAPTFASALRALRPGGRIVAVGNVVAEKVPVNLGFLITYGLSILGGSGATRHDMVSVQEMHARTPFDFPIERELPLSAADEAQRLVREGNLHGRIVLRPQL